MLRKFAENISESKDRASYWEINRYNLPAPVNYKDDTQFWYNLPANFDLLDACYRMYIWTGDSTYVSDPAFKNFYRRTVHDFVDRWDLSLDRIMTRARIMNTRGHADPTNRFQTNRGIPSYDEGDPNFVVAVDQLAVQYAGYLAYARLAALDGDTHDSSDFLSRAESVKAFLNTTWWNSKSGTFYSRVNLGHKLEGQGLNRSLLYYGAAEEGVKSSALVKSILNAISNKQEIGIEEQSHLPEILYRYAEPAAAYEQILDLTREDKDRREYPEVSFSVIGAIVTGLMGLDIESSAPSSALADGGYVEGPLVTTSRLTSQTQWAEINNVPVRANRIRLRHDGSRKSTLENLNGPSLVWKACFPGSFPHLLVDKRTVAADSIKRQNQTLSCVSVPVAPANTRTIQALDRPPLRQ